MRNSSCSLSFIVPCRNVEDTLAATLTSIFAQDVDCPFEVIVVNNLSKDKTLEVARQFPVRICSEFCRGPNFARNLGIANARGKFIAFVDADVVLEKNWARTLLAYMERHSLSAASGKIIRAPFRDPESILEKYRSLNQQKKTQGLSLVTPEMNVGFINTAACVYEAVTLKTVSAFSSTLRFHEDVDLTYKLRQLPGISLGCTSAAVAHCFYTKGALSYFRRAIVYGYYYAFLERKWNLKKKVPTLDRIASFQLRLFDLALSSLRLLGQGIGGLRLRFVPHSRYEAECTQWKRISSLSKTGSGRVYFEDQEILNAVKTRTK